MTKLEIKLTKEQKEFFEYAAGLGGFRSLTDFILNAALTKAEEIVEEHNKIIAFKRDQEIFFDYVFKGAEPNQELKSVLKAYKELL